MFTRNFIALLSILFFTSTLYSQKDSLNVKGVKLSGDLKVADKVYNPLSPSKAAFFSAVFPGGGQIYNKKYWKAPIVWGALAIPTYYYLTSDTDYKRYRTAFKLRQNGLKDEFTLDDGNKLLSDDGLESAQRQLRQNRDLSLLSGIIIYILQIVEASVNAHLLQFNTSDNISLKPTIQPDPFKVESPTVGLTLKYSF
ncbi:hypothetical protein OD91_0977 [Lutibacter sp. Hel_I_33_5]|uniref:DUF5683 domain-containing protein n=1 Tax=Lutibacter sp. Hel_I_33_5 TaxID=1566289 RepID=UPI0011A876A4|nr:DUF5683 domain-containing protein [Lutibacter sp. Hel_I_33_5]TVZ55712.1 hypothetical protein OD91_0977 [Lutibacter sp. Hel_I_33_5]